MNNTRLTKALSRFVKKVRDERIYGTLGRGANYTDVVAPRKNHVWVTPDGSSPVMLPNTGKGQVPLRKGLRVKLLRLDTGKLVLDGYDEDLMEDDAHLPDDYGNNPHPLGSHTDTDFGAVVDRTDAYVVTWNGDTGMFVLEAQAGALVTSVNGQTGAVVLDADDIDDSATTNKFATAAELTKLAGIETGADVTDAGNIASSITGSSTDDTIADADVWGYLTGGALVQTAWSNIKAVLKTYFDTLYNLYVHPNHTGDVTSVGDGATTIANDAVTFAKMQNIATDSLIGRDTASSGDPETIGLNATLSMDGAGNLQRAALTGDVTANAGSNATTIANDAVSNAKLANMAANTLKANITGSTADPSDVTVASFLSTYLGVTVAADGSIIRGSTPTVREWAIPISTINASQTLTIDLTAGAARRRYLCDLALVVATSAANVRHALLRGDFAFGVLNSALGVAATINLQDMVYSSSNNTVTPLTAITDGVRITVVADGTGGYQENVLYLRAVGPECELLTLTVSIT